jgi:alcohol dehydrogenase class IV
MNIIPRVMIRIFHQITGIAMRLLNFPTPDIIVGQGSMGRLVDQIKKDQVEKILVVTDANIHKLGLLKELIEKLEKKEIKIAIFDGVNPNPTIKNIDEAYQMYIDQKCNGIIAVGGGSSIDCAKVAGARAVSGKSVMKLKGNYKVGRKLPPFYAIPTTSGTGSEATMGAVVSNMETHEKFTVADPNLIPKIAVLDPSLTLGLPPKITAATGVDALTHAVEAYICVIRNKTMKENAEKAVKMVFENLEKAYMDGSDLEVRENMALASFYAGVALSEATGYAHAIGHNLGSYYDIIHGTSVGVVLPYLLREYGNKCHDELAELALYCGFGTQDMTNEKLAGIFIKKFEELNKNIGIPSRIKELKVEDIPLLAKRAAKEGNPIYPVPKIFNKKEFEQFLPKLIQN